MSNPVRFCTGTSDAPFALPSCMLTGVDSIQPEEILPFTSCDPPWELSSTHQSGLPAAMKWAMCTRGGSQSVNNGFIQSRAPDFLSWQMHKQPGKRNCSWLFIHGLWQEVLFSPNKKVPGLVPWSESLLPSLKYGDTLINSQYQMSQGGIYVIPNAQKHTKTSKCCIFMPAPVVIFVVHYWKDIQTESVAKETREQLCFFDRATLFWVRRWWFLSCWGHDLPSIRYSD